MFSHLRRLAVAAGTVAIMAVLATIDPANRMTPDHVVANVPANAWN